MDRTEQREKQRTQAAHRYIESDAVDAGNEKLAFGDFINGAKWADQHPNWISVKDELPKHDTDESGLVSFPMVLVRLYDGYRDTSYYDDIGEEWGDYDGEVEYWMPMPPAPAKED